MTRLPARTHVALLAVILASAPAAAEEAAPDAAAILEKSQAAFYYAGSDMKARVRMDLLTGTGQKRTRVLSMLRVNVPGGKDQKYFLYFHEPGDVRRTAFLVLKYPQKDDDRSIFIPAVNMVRRVAARDSRSSFVGSDFTYEDISGRDLEADAHKLLRKEKVGEAMCFLIESVPKAAAEYARKLSFIDVETFLPRREEYYDLKGKLARVFTADRIEKVPAASSQAIPTVVHRTMANVETGHRTEVTFDGVAYDVGLPMDIFSEASLESPPEKWIR